jgi:hypothetical protein
MQQNSYILSVQKHVMVKKFILLCLISLSIGLRLQSQNVGTDLTVHLHTS